MKRKSWLHPRTQSFVTMNEITRINQLWKSWKLGFNIKCNQINFWNSWNWHNFKYLRRVRLKGSFSMGDSSAGNLKWLYIRQLTGIVKHN